MRRLIVTAGPADALIQDHFRPLVCAGRLEANRHDYADALPAFMDLESTAVGCRNFMRAAVAGKCRFPTLVTASKGYPRRCLCAIKAPLAAARLARILILVTYWRAARVGQREKYANALNGPVGAGWTN